MQPLVIVPPHGDLAPERLKEGKETRPAAAILAPESGHRAAYSAGTMRSSAGESAS